MIQSVSQSCKPPCAPGADWEEGEGEEDPEPGEGPYVAVHDFPGQQDTQLALSPGDVVTVHSFNHSCMPPCAPGAN